MKGTYKIAEHAAWRKVGAEIVVLDLESSDYFTLNESGARMWELYAKGLAVEQVADAVRTEWGIDPRRALKDARAFARRLAQRRLVKPA